MKRFLFLTAAAVLAGCSASATEAQGGDPLGCVVALMIESRNAKQHGNFELPAQISPFTKWYALAGRDVFLTGDGKDHVMKLAKEHEKDWQRRKTVAKGCVSAAAENPAFEQALPQLNTLPEMTMQF